MESKRPEFETVGFGMVKCNIDPDTCPARHALIKKDRLPKYWCWHEDSPEPDQGILQGYRYRRCITKPKEVDIT